VAVIGFFDIQTLPTTTTITTTIKITTFGEAAIFGTVPACGYAFALDRHSAGRIVCGSQAMYLPWP
jgi:hypothetical protein